MIDESSLPPAWIVIVFRDLAECELLVLVWADPLGGINRAYLQGRIDVAGRNLLGYATEPLDRLPRKPSDAKFKTVEIGDFLDLLAETSAHLAACPPRAASEY
jgi:hypothetical protein